MVSIERLMESCVIEDIDNMSDFDKRNFENRKSYLAKEDAQQLLSVILTRNSDYYTDMIDKALESLRDMVVTSAELTQFFEKIIESPMIDDLPITSKVYDISVIDKIRPSYLSQVTNDMMNNINDLINDKRSFQMIEGMYLSDQYLVNCKKKMVRTTIPYTCKNVDIVKADSGMIVKIDGEFISSNLLPFLRNIPQSIKEMTTLCGITNTTMEKCYEDVSIYANTVNRLGQEGKVGLKKFRDLNEYMYKASRNFMQLSSYLTFIIIKKIQIYMANIRSYNEIRTRILQFYPEGESVLHESVIDGNLDNIDMHELVHEVLMNNNSMFRSFLHTVIDREKADAAYAMGPVNGDSLHSIVDQEISQFDYQSKIGPKIVSTFTTIHDAFDILRENAKDGMIPFDDIIEKSGLNQDMEKRFSSLLTDIQDTNYYESILASDHLNAEDKKDLYFMILHELSDLDTSMDQAVEAIHLAFKNYCDVTDDLSQSDPLIYPNEETNRELVDFLENFDSNFRHFILNVMVSVIDRVKSLKECLSELKDEVVVNVDISPALSVESAEEDLYDSIIESYQDLSNFVDGLYFEEAIKDYNRKAYHYMTGGNLIYEDGPATSPNAENNAQTQQKSANEVKKEVANKAADLKGSIQKIINAIKNFFSKSVQQMQDIMTKQSGNLTWLQNNKEALENRSFNGVTINVLPYEQNWTTDQILSDVRSLRDKINALNETNIKQYNSKKKLNAYLFSFMENGVGNRENINEIAKNYYKVKNAKLEVMPYKGAQAKSLVPTMVDYCIAYYSGFGDDLTKAMNELSKTLTDKVQTFETLKESVMFEAEGDNNQGGNQGEENSTKASVQVSNNSVQNTKEDASAKGTGTDNTTTGVFNIIKWISMSVQYFSAAVMGGTRDRNYDYLKVLKGILPKNANQNNEQQPAQEQEAQQTENQ